MTITISYIVKHLIVRYYTLKGDAANKGSGAKNPFYLGDVIIFFIIIIVTIIMIFFFNTFLPMCSIYVYKTRLNFCH